MICKKCGAETDEATKFCPICGKKQKRPAKNRWLKILVIVLMIPVVAFAALFAGVKISDMTSDYNRICKQLEEEDRIFVENCAVCFRAWYGTTEDIVVLSVWMDGENYQGVFKKGDKINFFQATKGEYGYGLRVVENYFAITGQDIPETEFDVYGITRAIQACKESYILTA